MCSDCMWAVTGDRVQWGNWASHVWLQISLSQLLLQHTACHCRIHSALLPLCNSGACHWTASDRAACWPWDTSTSHRPWVHPRHYHMALHSCRLPCRQPACKDEGTTSNLTAFRLSTLITACDTAAGHRVQINWIITNQPRDFTKQRRML